MSNTGSGEPLVKSRSELSILYLLDFRNKCSYIVYGPLTLLFETIDFYNVELQTRLCPLSEYYETEL